MELGKQLGLAPPRTLSRGNAWRETGWGSGGIEGSPSEGLFFFFVVFIFFFRRNEIKIKKIYTQTPLVDPGDREDDILLEVAVDERRGSQI